jgi:hypothetical protein
MDRYIWKRFIASDVYLPIQTAQRERVNEVHELLMYAVLRTARISEDQHGYKSEPDATNQSDRE